MSKSADLENTIEAAFEARDGISSATKGAVREAVEDALNLLDSGQRRVAERQDDGTWVGQSMAEKGRAPVLPPRGQCHHAVHQCGRLAGAGL